MGEYISPLTQFATGSNPTLKGHKLLIAIPMDVPQAFLDAIKAEFSDLDVVHHKLEWGLNITAPFPDEEWRDVTVLMTFATLPTVEQAPRLQFVQLISAGANHILDKPIFKDTDVKFCTANGVHG
jgi:hypothetical protein